MIMKRFLLVFTAMFLAVSSFSPCSAMDGQKKAKKCNVRCDVTFSSVDPLPEGEAVLKGVLCKFSGPDAGKDLNLYALEGAKVYLISGKDTVATGCSDYEGVIFMKKVLEGEYECVCTMDGYKESRQTVVISPDKAYINFVMDEIKENK